MTRWVLADYGEVVSDPIPAETIGELADLAGMRRTSFATGTGNSARPMTSASPTVLTGRLSLATSSRLSRS